MYLIVGLGNPGIKYDYTRHNAGFMFMDYFAKKHNIDIKKIKFKGLLGEGFINGEKVALLKPSTFMNLSGESVAEAMNFYKLTPDKLIVVYDDISLQLGRMRIREKGSAGGHNGIKSIIYMLNSDSFKRIKIGVGTDEPGKIELVNFVLSKFTDEQIKVFASTVERACSAAELLLEEKTAVAMNLYN